MVELTDRQREIYELLIHGMDYEQVARKLDLSYRTVRFHTARMAAKIPGNGAPLRKVLTYALENTAENGRK